MARSLIARRHEARREREALFDASLRRVSRAPKPAPDVERALRDAHFGMGISVREGATWRPKVKSRDFPRLRLAAARHLFGLYPVPFALEAVWLDTDGLDAAEVALRKRWFVVAAGGGSLWRAGLGEWLSRKEVHRFLNPPGPLSFEAAFWQAVARSYTDDAGLALRIARSKIAGTPRAELGFWREAARFFCVNPVSLAEIDDLCDFIRATRERDRNWSLKGRTLVSLGRQMREWHLDLAAVQRMERQIRAMREAERRHGRLLPEREGWDGVALANWSWRTAGKGASREAFTVVQLKTAAELVAESRAMHHCVWSYAQKCLAGRASIWSLRRKADGVEDRLLTVELNEAKQVVQVRGSANRLAKPAEEQVLGRWAAERGIGWGRG